IAACLQLAIERGEVAAGADPRIMATLLVDCWEGAALRSRLRGNAQPLNEMLDFYFTSAVGRGTPNP
ncbi:MAG: TetR family transcriptional regulator C-terminal domain-containing protein, partial [Glutamicibacter sp.]